MGQYINPCSHIMKREVGLPLAQFLLVEVKGILAFPPSWGAKQPQNKDKYHGKYEIWILITATVGGDASAYIAWARDGTSLKEQGAKIWVSRVYTTLREEDMYLKNYVECY